MSVRDRSRKTEAKTEGILALLVILMLVPVLLLAYWGHTRADVPANAVYINDSDMTAEKIAQSLGVKADVGNALLQERIRRGHFESVEQITGRRALHLDEQTTRIIQSRVLVRHASQVFRNYVLVCALLVFVAFFVPVWLRQKMRVGGDPFLIPLMLLVSGFGVVMLFCVKDPLRDPAAYVHHAQGLALALLAFLFAARIAPLPARKSAGCSMCGCWLLLSSSGFSLCSGAGRRA